MEEIIFEETVPKADGLKICVGSRSILLLPPAKLGNSTYAVGKLHRTMCGIVDETTSCTPQPLLLGAASM